MRDPRDPVVLRHVACILGAGVFLGLALAIVMATAYTLR